MISAASYATQLARLLPPGAAWEAEPGSALAQFLLGIGDELSRVDGRGDDLINETDPRTTLELLPDWERVFGLPDACVGANQTTDQRRAGLIARWVSRGGANRAYFIAVAAALGYTITITEFDPFDVEDDCDAPLYGDAWAYAWQVNAALATVTELSVEDPVDEPLAWWGNTALECVLSRLKPAHTIVLFTYS